MIIKTPIPMTTPEVLDAILDGDAQPPAIPDLPKPTRISRPRADKDGRVHLRCATPREAEERVDRMLARDPDQEIAVYLAGSDDPSYVVTWPKEDRRRS